MTSTRQLSLDVVDREIVLAHRHGQLPDSVSRRCFLGAAPDFLEEPGTFRSIVPELMTEDAKSSGRVRKASRDLFRKNLFNEVGSKRFVLSVEGFFGREEELSFWGDRYSITSTDRHGSIML